MKNLLMVCVLGISMMFGACAHKSCGECKDGSCKMEHKDKKECGCGHDHGAGKKADDKKAEDKK
jgi:hypothetical protein